MGLYIGNNKYKVMVGNQKCSFVTEDKVLPYDYEVEYLESNNNQLIRTGIIPTNLTGSSGEFMWTGSSGAGYICAARADGRARHYLCSIESMGLVTYGFGTIYTNIGISPTFNIKHTSSINYYNNRQFIYDNIVRVNNLPNEDFTNMTYDLCLFGGNYAGRLTGNLQGRIYWVKITEGDSLIADFIPVVKDNIGYMYDKISGRLFANEPNRGKFVIGPRVNN